jgi:hypothetical protein
MVILREVLTTAGYHIEYQHQIWGRRPSDLRCRPFEAFSSVRGALGIYRNHSQLVISTSLRRFMVRSSVHAYT